MVVAVENFELLGAVLDTPHLHFEENALVKPGIRGTDRPFLDAGDVVTEDLVLFFA